jgi:formylglycine-generating enzyme required for sulfatase activity
MYLIKILSRLAILSSLSIVVIHSAYADSFKDCPECPEMIALPAGSFAMGSDTVNEDDANWPKRTVQIKAFAIGKFEVLQDEWQAIMGNRPGGFKGERLPVEQITWKLAKEFTRKLSEKTGKNYRLASEAEWEYAARAGTESDYYFGNDIERLPEHAWFDENSNETTHTVGQKLPNKFGLYDMYGNVAEWTDDCWNKNYSDAPTDGSAWVVGDCSVRVVRGGSWFNKPRSFKSSTRIKFSSEIRYSSRGLGLRVVRDAP